jgi:beta-ribofuranosylaminobenzene 5'-phosphate synthase
MLIRVRASSRLHFGLLRLPCADDPPDARVFGGVGLMVRAPAVRIALRPAPTWSASSPLGERALDFAKRAATGLASAGADVRPFAIEVEAAPPEHSGLGTGTQLALAVSRAVAAASLAPSPSPPSLAALVGRGTRSAIGTHGFAHGGFLVDGGKASKTRIAPLIARCEFPEDWRVVLVLPRGRQGLHGASERDVFAQSAPADAPGQTDVLCRLVLLGMLPALRERDLTGFGAALYEFNRRVGDMFRRWQGGTYAHAETAALVEYIRRQGVPGTGQSSWGPTVFAITEAQRAGVLAERLRERFALSAHEVLITEADNRGAEVEIEPKP